MLCKDCIHFDVCKDATVPNPEYKGEQLDKSKECRHFKNKADVMEVVRCRSCKHAYFKYNMKDTMQEIYACRKRPAGRCHKKVSGDFFCKHGERSNT